MAGVNNLNLRTLAFHLQRTIKAPQLRDRIGGWVSALREPAGYASDLNPARSGQLRKEGLCWLGQVLAAQQIAEICAWFESRKVENFYRPEDGAFLPLSDTRDPLSHVANHSLADVLAAPHLIALAMRPEILSLVEEYLGCKPAITAFSAWWSYPTPVGPQHAEFFHRDVDDWRFIKFFVYLTDVGELQGPHVYVTHSAQRPELRNIARLSDQDVVGTFGEGNVKILTGKAGDAFLEDTSGVHRGTPVRQDVRLLFQVVYGLVPLPNLPRRPVLKREAMEQLHGITLDPHVSRYILS